MSAAERQIHKLNYDILKPLCKMNIVVTAKKGLTGMFMAKKN